MRLIFGSLCLLWTLTNTAFAQSCPALSPAQAAHAAALHSFAGLPSEDSILVRRGYVLSYDHTHRVPRWASWHASPAYRAVPDRDVSRWGRFHTDPDITNPVEDDDFDGLFRTADNFARGHIVPYYISGGDRDGDSLGAADAEGDELVDLDDACTVFEIMYMSNIAPQYHYRFNGSGGLWYELETALRDLIDSQDAEFHVIAGTVFGAQDVQFVGPANDQTIGVPDMFFKIVVTDAGPIGFLFTHRRQLIPEACPLEAELVDCIVPISVIENVSGLDFFSSLGPTESGFETIDGLAAWQTVTGTP